MNTTISAELKRKFTELPPVTRRHLIVRFTITFGEPETQLNEYVLQGEPCDELIAGWLTENIVREWEIAPTASIKTPNHNLQTA